MKIFFLETDTLFKIFKTLEKVSQGKKISIYIEQGNDFFVNEWRASQIKEVIERKQLQATFISQSTQTKNYFEKVGLPYHYEGTNKRREAIRNAYLFIFDLKKFHTSIYQKKHYLSYLIFGGELIIVGIILYILYVLIIPSSTVTITPEYKVEDIIYNFRYYPHNTTQKILESDKLSIPYQIATLKHDYTLNTNVQNISSKQKPAEGSVVVYNTTSRIYDILNNTQFVTDDGMVFRSRSSFSIPAGSVEQPGTVTVELLADDLDVYDNLIGQRGNIDTDTVLYIKNLTESYFLKNIYAITPKPFTNGETISRGSITQEDMNQLEQNLLTHIEENKEAIVREVFSLPDGIVLPFEDLISFDASPVRTSDRIGDIKTKIQGTLDLTLYVPYIQEKSLIKAIHHYLDQRKTFTQQLIDIDTKSLVFYPIKTQEETILTIPTSVSAIFGYDFDHDVNNIKENIKDNIIGQGIDYATTQVLTHPEVAAARISVNPPRYGQIPTTKSRIFFKTRK